MKAMLLAAGHGKRMRPLTDQIPKPLLSVGGKSLIEYHLQTLSNAGIQECVINLGYRGTQIREALGDGRRYGIDIHYSDEGEQPLETAGGIIKALPLLGGRPFLVINADIWTDFPLRLLPEKPKGLVHLVMVDNPKHHTDGDFTLNEGRIHATGDHKLTYSGIGLYDPALFSGYQPERRPLLPVLLNAIQAGQVYGQHYQGIWEDIGTPERLQALDQRLSKSTV